MNIKTKRVETLETRIYCDYCKREMILVKHLRLDGRECQYDYECRYCIDSKCSTDKLYPLITYQDID